MPIRTSEKEGIFFIRLEDRVSMEDNLEFARWMKEATAQEWRMVLVLVNSKVINSYCLGTLFAGYREMSVHDKILRVVCNQPFSRSSIGHFDPQGLLPVFESVEEALSDGNFPH